MFLKLILTISLFTFSNSKLLPPIPEAWNIQINDIHLGINKESNWLKDYMFYAPLRVKPGQNWNAYIEAIWVGPSLLDNSLLEYIELEFSPLDPDVYSNWSGDKKLIASSIDLKTNKIKFRPENNQTFMIAPKDKIGVYNNMYFTLTINKQRIPSMFVFINTRLNRDVEVTCSDNLFCNGEERFVNGKCVNSKYKPCDDPSGDPCKSFECIEEERECKTRPIGGSNCNECNKTNTNVFAKCLEMSYECGWDDNKTLFCGKCSSDEYVCSRNKCILRSALGPGSCYKPHQLLNSSLTIPQQGINNLVVYGDLSLPIYTDNVIPICNPAPVPDVVYEFRIENDNVEMGMEVQMMKADGTNDVMDTVLALTGPNCEPLPLYSFCGDDSSPPGGVSSRVFGKLKNGLYKLVASGFSNIPSNVGPFMLLIKFYPNCIPQCEGNRKCGSDGCGGQCGECPIGTLCNYESGQCRANPCLPKCTLTSKDNQTDYRECGDNSCGGFCGSCNLKNLEMCITQSGKCKKVSLCNNLRPECDGRPPAHMEKPYCGHDCKWHDLKEQLGDLMPNGRELVVRSIEFDWRLVGNRSCAMIEGCFRFEGKRFLMRFDTYVHNVGRETFYPPEPEEAPNQFEWSPCHAHYHYDGFASFNLYDLNSKLIAAGGKRGYCMEDTVQTIFAEHVPCTNFFSCSKQGIQPGWADLYPNVLDCQWIDITDIEKEKWYVYEICTNVERKLTEAAYLNNCKRFPVYVPHVEFSLDKQPLKHDDILKDRNITIIPEIEQEPGNELSIEITQTNNISLISSILNFLANFLFKFLF